MTVRWLLVLLPVLVGLWLLRRWLLRDFPRGGDVVPVAVATDRDGGEERFDGVSDAFADPLAEAERRAERSRPAVRERGERMPDADRVSEQGARLARLDRALSVLERDAPSGRLLELRRLHGELAALRQGGEPSEEAISSLERRVEAFGEPEPAGAGGRTAAAATVSFGTPQGKDDLKGSRGRGHP